jgi:hypothetical protein
MIALTTAVLGCSMLTTPGALTLGVPATSTPTVAPQPSPDPAGAVSGKLESVDWEAKNFTIRLESTEHSVIGWNDDTLFMLNGEKSTAEKVLVTDGKLSVSLDKEGDAVSVSRVAE